MINHTWGKNGRIEISQQHMQCQLEPRNSQELLPDARLKWSRGTQVSAGKLTKFWALSPFLLLDYC